ncbi:MAG: peptide chain release factor N(5)-glutamine methyltransferase [Bradyrhizobiaceae bacterium]|nr:MAG: peptide chain release factor N(5)-glutamine methyltransferase [Bradyrhizobiaceae bacterium]
MNGASGFEGLSIDDARRRLAASFASCGLDSPELDARMLVGEALGLDLTGLIAQGARQMTVHDALILSSFAQRRLAGEPVARILGRKEFFGLSFDLSPATLVPRPDTETVVEAALEIVRSENRAGDALRIADIGTGSGAILLALLSELPHATGIGTDISREAVETARHNAQKLGLGARAAFVECVYASALTGPFDLIVSNPPYVASREINRLAVDVRDHDPHIALDGGDDGLDAYRAIAPAACELLGPGGALIFEVGAGQDTAVQDIMRAVRLTAEAPPRRDLGGIDRCVIGRKMPVNMRF